MRFFAIIPAAGVSRRMGCPKLLMLWRGATVIQAVLQAWKQSRADQVMVVVRPDDDVLAAVCELEGVRVVRPGRAPPEMRDSIREGLTLVQREFGPRDEDAWLLAPADMPLITSDLINTVLKAHDPSDPRIIVPTFRGTRGHPVLFPWKFADEVDRLAADEGVNAIVRRVDPLLLETGRDWVLADLDTPEDYRRLGG